MPVVIALLFTRKHPLFNLPQVAETNTPWLMDVAGVCLLYDEFMVGILSWIIQVLES
jgi:hypothetical protein